MNSLHVFPGVTMHGLMDGPRPYTKDPCQAVYRLAVRVALPNLAHLVGIQLDQRFRPTALCRHILHVLRLGSQEEVVGANAAWIVAGMKYPHPRGDGTIVQFPAKSVGRDDPSTAIEMSVSTPGASARPFPAPAASVDVTPKALFGRGEARSVVARWRAVTASTMANLRRIYEKGVSTLATGAGNFATLRTHFSDLLNRSGGAVPGAFVALPGVRIVPKNLVTTRNSGQVAAEITSAVSGAFG